MSISPSVARGKVGSESINNALLDAVTADKFAVAGLPDATKHEGKIIYVSNGAAGEPRLAYSNGTNWLRITLGAAVATS